MNDLRPNANGHKYKIPCTVSLVDVPEFKLAVRGGRHDVCAVEELNIGDCLPVALAGGGDGRP